MPATSRTPATLPPTFLSATVHPSSPLTSTLATLPTPSPTSLPPNHLLIRVHAAASNPKDYLHLRHPFNSGDDLAGTVVGVSSNVTRFKIGDRVAAFHQMGTEYGAYAEFAVAPSWTAVKLPEGMGWEEGSTLPLVVGTAGVTLFRRLGLGVPWEESGRKENEGKMLLVNGASSALGVLSVKLAKLAGVGMVIAVGGGSAMYVKGVLGEKDVFVDYRVGIEKVVEEVRRVVEERGWKVIRAIDCVSANESWVGISRMMDGGVLSVVSGRNKYEESGIREGVEIVYTYVGSLHTGTYPPGMPKQPSEKDAAGDVAFARDLFEWTEAMLAEGKLGGHPYQVVPGGLEGVVDGLYMLKAGEAKGRKFVYRIAA